MSLRTALFATMLACASGFTVMVPPHAARAVSRSAIAVDMNFFDDMQSAFNKMVNPPPAPTLEEAKQYCFDEESSGCSLEMMDLLEKEQQKSAPQQKYRWSQDIDDAVFKTD